jgi:hypothetical protein
MVQSHSSMHSYKRQNKGDSRYLFSFGGYFRVSEIRFPTLRRMTEWMGMIVMMEMTERMGMTMFLFGELPGESEINNLMFENIYFKFFVNFVYNIESILISIKEEIDLSFLKIFIRI